MSPQYVTPEERERDDDAREDAAEQRAGNEMLAVDDRAEQLSVAESMVRFGGQFIRLIGYALPFADPDNAAKIKAAFPVEWAKYKEMKGGNE